ncbi:MAG: pyridoxine 5'-phosphate synthase [Methyloligella sp. ZOD6]
MTSEVSPIRLGINVDHVATLRNARGEVHPDVVRAAQLAIDSGADNITAHLREDRRHIRDADIAELVTLSAPLNMEMAVTPEMLQIALRTKPHATCLVPERREELTTEGGLDAESQVETLKPFVAKLREAGIRVSLFIDPDEAQIEAAAKIESDAVELHTGTYCEAGLAKDQTGFERELARLEKAARMASEAGLEVHAGHGLTYGTVGPVAAIPQIVELNIGHFLVGEAIFVGLGESVRHMRWQMDRARRAAGVPGKISGKAPADETL